MQFQRFTPHVLAMYDANGFDESEFDPQSVHRVTMMSHMQYFHFSSMKGGLTPRFGAGVSPLRSVNIWPPRG